MFIYVMDAESKDKLIELGYEFLKKNAKKDIWVFINKLDINFEAIDIPCVVSDVLTF